MTAPTLPAEWTTSGTGTSNPWVTSSTSPDLGANSAFIADITTVSETSLTSPTFIAPANAQILFRNSYDLEYQYDGGVLEISINGGAFTDIVTAGGSFETAGYNSTLNTGFSNPLEGRSAWTGNSGGYINTTVNLPAAAFGQSVQLRWRMGTDTSTAETGWRIDTIRLVGDYDFGDAPAPYPTTLAENGAQHSANGPTLGATRDAEPNGAHSVDADGDGADDDGVMLGTIQVGALGTMATVTVAGAPSGAKLDAWIDFNGDGDWGGPGEQIAASVAVVNGNNTITFDVPSWAKDGVTYARFRLSTAGSLGVTGVAADGEVEDYAVTIIPPAIASGTFGGQNTVTTAADSANSVFAADVDGDGDMDMLSASGDDDTIAWYENDGSQNFTVHTITTAAMSASSVFAADVDGDGDLDVLSASLDDAKIAWYENIDIPRDFGDAPGPYPTTHAENGARHTPTGPTLGATRDSEADGAHSANADADGADEDGVTFGTIQIGVLGATAMVTVAGAPSGAKLDAWIDFNGDGNWGGPGEQIAASVAVVNGVNVITFDVPSTAKGGVTYARFRLSTAGSLGVTGVAANGEVEDYAVTITPAPALGVFSSPNVVTNSANGPRSVVSADIDGDGDMDIVSALQSGSSIEWYENNGDQTFTAHTISNSAFTAMSVFAADVDGDGDMDVLGALLQDDTIEWYENDGNQNFTTRTISLAADGASSVFAADMDGDGDLDVLSASLLDDKIAWYENDGNQTFTAHTITTAADQAWSVIAADVDGDGDLDVLSASYYDDKIAWYENDGNQNFTAHTISTAADGDYSVFAADMDGDGDLDVLSASAVDDKIAWYENDGSPSVGAWVEHTISTAVNGASSVVAADVDGDGDLDVVSASPLNTRSPGTRTPTFRATLATRRDRIPRRAPKTERDTPRPGRRWEPLGMPKRTEHTQPARPATGPMKTA